MKPKQTLKDVQLYRPKPSKESKSGYSGRLGIVEVLTVDDTIKELIIKKASTREIKNQAVQSGMRTMIEDGFRENDEVLDLRREVAARSPIRDCRFELGISDDRHLLVRA